MLVGGQNGGLENAAVLDGEEAGPASQLFFAF
jgi:hypothetical protein